MQKFWIVMRDEMRLNATFRHRSEEGARREAERLTRELNGTFFVFELQAVCERAPTPIQWIETDSASDDDDAVGENESPDWLHKQCEATKPPF